MTLKALQARCDYWQTRLNLREWKLTLGWGTGRANAGDEVFGCCIWSAEELTATIHITPRLPKQEETLVHELLHIVTQGHLPEVPEYDVHLERALNRLAKAFMEEGE